ncbi:hypothetical protein C1646_755054 [Rhizophagus diaphanus]|nr:hypothetical protein C1646_755054 [Rhizophagus diaphanus] [Rhizophagus sp. MUCL 43196]
MSSLKCPYCPRIFTNKSRYTQHVSNCVSPPEIDNDSEELELVANINDMSLDSEELTHNFEKTFEDILDILEDSDPNEKIFEDILEESESK